MYVYTQLLPKYRDFVDTAIREIPDIQSSITKQQIQRLYDSAKIQSWPNWITAEMNRLSRGIYNFPHPSLDENFDPNAAPAFNFTVPTPVIPETDEEISIRIRETFATLDDLVLAVSQQTIPGFVLSGGAGLSKSYKVNKILTDANGGEWGHQFHRGYLKATGLYKLIWENRQKGQTIVLDDCDIWNDETSLNILKAALELKPTRLVCWGSEYKFQDQDGQEIPRYFEYEGSIIFLTNLQFRDIINSGGKLAPHLSAIESRSLILDLKIKTRREYLIKIEHALEEGLLSSKGIIPEEEIEIMDYVRENMDRFIELTLRTPEKIAALYKALPGSWRNRCNALLLK